MKSHPDIPSLGQLALHYGTINRQQLDRAQRLLAAGKADSHGLSLGEVLVAENMATPNQLNLLELIQEFLIIRKKGEKFGQIAIEKGFATRQQVDTALKKQQEEFRKAKLRRLIGDILVEDGVITPDQKEIITREQERLEKELDQVFTAADGTRSDVPPDEKGRESDIRLSEAEKAFLELQTLDRNFADQVVEKGFAGRPDVDRALVRQKKAFEDLGQATRLGDIMIQDGILTPQQRDLILAEQNRLAPEPAAKALKTDPGGNGFTIRISGSRLEARLERSPGQDQPILLASVLEALDHQKVTWGRLDNALIQSLLDSGQDLFLLARGTFPTAVGQEFPRYYFTETDKTSATAPPPSGRTVSRGEALAELEPSPEALDGQSVFGDPVKPSPELLPETPPFLCGTGVRLSRDGIKAFAGRSGTPHLSIDRRLYVFSPLNVLEDADLRFGPLGDFSDISVAGILTGAYPVMAGTIRAREIRDADIDALADIKVTIGITNTRIRTQGSVYARYIHNTTIEAFGDVVVEHEIIDSNITVSGRCRSEKGRIIASSVTAKQGVDAGGVGSDVTEPCRLGIGREDHVVLQTSRLQQEIEEVLQGLAELETAAEELSAKSAGLLSRMGNLKRLHDRAKKKKSAVIAALETRSERPGQDEREKTLRLIEDLSQKMKNALASIRELNTAKKKADRELAAVKARISSLRPGIEKKVSALELDKTILLEWADRSPVRSILRVRGRIAQDTVIRGVVSEVILAEEHSAVDIVESADQRQGLSGARIEITPIAGSGDRSRPLFHTRQTR